MSIEEAEREINNKIKALCEKINSGESDREFIEVCYPGPKSSEGYGMLTFYLGIDVYQEYNLDMVIINPAGKNDSSHTYLQIFLFKDKDEKRKFREKVLKMHMELDENVVKMFNEGNKID